MRIAENFYVYFWNNPRENNCNSIFIDGKTPVLIDPGHLHRVKDLFGKMQEDGVDPKKIAVVLLTHAHPDHFEGIQAFDSKVKIGISTLEERFVDEIGRPLYAKQGMPMPEFRIDFNLTEGDLTLGRHEFQVMLTPGHSPGSISIYWPRYKTLITGDVIFAQSIGRVDLPGGDKKLLQQSIEKLSRIPAELILPGHGPAVQGAERVRQNFDMVKRMFFGV